MNKVYIFAKSFAATNKQIHVYKNNTNQGIAITRNTGIQYAMGKFLAFLDSDDYWDKKKLEKQIHIMNKTNATISYTGTSYIDAKGHASKYILRAKTRLGYKDLLRGNIMSCSSVMVHRDSMINFPQGNMHEDYAVWLLILKKIGYAHGLDEPLITYRVSKNSISAKRVGSAIKTRNAYKYVGYGTIASTLLMCRYAVHSIIKRMKIKQGAR